MCKIYKELPTKEQLLVDFDDINDPTSINYKRVLTYPKFNIISIFLNVLSVIVVLALLISLLMIFTNNIIITVSVSIVVLSLYIFIRLSALMIFIVKLYQKFAPKSLRMKCRFEPSCSDYMIGSIKKYGPFKGFINGIKRCKRCKYPNGGFDEP